MRTPHDRRAARRGIRPLLALAALTAAMLSATVVQTASAASPGPAAATSGKHRAPADKVCAAATSGHAACMALVRTDVQGVKADAMAPGAVPAGYGVTRR